MYEAEGSHHLPFDCCPTGKETPSDMKITCPECGAIGSLPAHEIPSEGRFLNCPRCKNGFTVTKPRSDANTYLVDTCPACNFSTFGEENFGTCPKCGVVVKAFVERQREEQLQKRNAELLNKKLRCEDAVLPPQEEVKPSVGELLENMHPVNLIGWGIAAASIIIAAFGLWGVIELDSARIKAQLTEQREHEVSAFYVFMRYSLDNWIRIIYGMVSCYVAFLFMKHRKISIKALKVVVWCAIIYVPLVHLISFINWAMAPIPHTFSGYVIEFFNAVFVSALVGIPLYVLIRYLDERPVTSVVRL